MEMLEGLSPTLTFLAAAIALITALISLVVFVLQSKQAGQVCIDPKQLQRYCSTPPGAKDPVCDIVRRSAGRRITSI